MYVTTTKKMAAFLAQRAKKAGLPYEIVHREISAGAYAMNTRIDRCCEWADYNAKTGLYNVIVVLYPYEYYAPARYLCTEDLVDCFKRSNKTLDGYIAQVFDEIAI